MQASIIIIFVPNADECHFIQQLIKNMFIKELKREEEREEQQKLKETKLRNEEAKQMMEGKTKKRSFFTETKNKDKSNLTNKKDARGKC